MNLGAPTFNDKKKQNETTLLAPSIVKSNFQKLQAIKKSNKK
jgi:hypothetical protein